MVYAICRAVYARIGCGTTHLITVVDISPDILVRVLMVAEGCAEDDAVRDLVLHTIIARAGAHTRATVESTITVQNTIPIHRV